MHPGLEQNISGFLSRVIDKILSRFSHCTVLHRETSAASFLAVLLAPVAIDRQRIGLRKFVLAAIDTKGLPLEASAIPKDLHLLNAELGVLGLCIFSNGQPSEEAKEQLHQLEATLISVTGEDFSNIEEAIEEISSTMFGQMPLRQMEYQLQDIPHSVREKKQGEVATVDLRRILIATIALYLSEAIVLKPETARRRMLSQALDGEANYLSEGYAVMQVRFGEGVREFYLPSRRSILSNLWSVRKLSAWLASLDIEDTYRTTKLILDALLTELAAYLTNQSLI